MKMASSDVLNLYPRSLWLTQLIIEYYSKLHLFSNICFCMDIMMETVKGGNSTTLFGSNWSHTTNKKAESSIERTSQSKWWLKRRETRTKFLYHFYHPSFASEYDQNQLIISDLSWEWKIWSCQNWWLLCRREINEITDKNWSVILQIIGHD